MKSVLASAFVALFVVAAPTWADSYAEATESRQERKDLQVFNDIAGQVNRYTQLTVFDSISAEVIDGKVQLTGWVTMPYKRDDLERRVRKVEGVTSLDNKIQVLPVSQFDDDLRFRIARAIYGHSSFWNYAMMANPPIRVVVNRGRVTLEGVVNSNVERMLARSLASGFGAFEVRNELRTDAEVRAAMEPRKTN
ncbi:MAG: BON domain-containing protein [Acidobacteriota bacterium]|nr:BON domain-containing protein [Acidobacteriota bacterium]